MERLYLDRENKLLLSCPECQKSKVVDATKMMKHKGLIKIKVNFHCSSCTQDIAGKHNERAVIIDRRKSCRKDVNFTGFLSSDDGHKIPVMVKDLSRNGIRLEMAAKHYSLPSKELYVEFILDDAKRTVIQKKIIVRRTAKKVVQAEFIDYQPYSKNDKAIGFYLMG